MKGGSRVKEVLEKTTQTKGEICNI